MPVPTIDPLPTPPSRAAPDTFSADADAYLAAFPGFREDLMALAAYLYDQAALAFAGVSTSNVTIGLGAKAFVLPGLALVPNQAVVISDSANPANAMTGTVTSYDRISGALVVNVTAFTGAGTKASWNIGLTPAATGAIVSSGLMQNPAKLLGRFGAGYGAVQEISLGAGLTLDGGGTLAANLDNDPTMAANSTNAAPTQQVVKAGLAAKLAASAVNNDPTLAGNSATDPPSVQAVRAYVGNLLEGLTYKIRVRAASTANVNVAAPGAALDGVALAAGDRVLLKNQTTASQNGLYVWSASGAALVRTADADTGPEMVNATVIVSEGSTQADQQWTCATNAPITLGTTSLTFVQTGPIPSFSQISGKPTSLSGYGITDGADLTSTQSLANKTLTNLTLDTAPVTPVVGNAPVAGFVRAFAMFNGIGVATINAASNVSSVTRNAAGLYTANFTAPMPDANYVPLYSYNCDTHAVDIYTNAPNSSSAPSIKTTSALQFEINNTSGVGVDSYSLGVTIVR